MTTDESLSELQTKIGAAICVSTYGAAKTGIATKQQLMHPYVSFKDIDVDNAAVTLLTSLHSQLQQLLPQTQKQKILKDLDEYLFFVVGDQQQSSKNRPQEG